MINELKECVDYITENRGLKSDTDILESFVLPFLTNTIEELKPKEIESKAALVKELRSYSGLCLMECKNVLQHSNWDIEVAKICLTNRNIRYVIKQS